MDGDGGVKVGLGGPHLHRNGRALDNFGSSISYHMRPQYLIRGLVDDQLHQGAGLHAGDGVVHGPEAGSVDFDVLLAVFGFGLFFGHAHSAHFGGGEDGGGHNGMAHQTGLVAKFGVGKDAPFLDGHGGEVDPASDITYGKDVGHGGTVVFIDDDGPVVDFDARLLQTETLNIGAASGGSKADGIGEDVLLLFRSGEGDIHPRFGFVDSDQ